MKTSLQELIEWLDKRIEDCNEIGGLEIAKWAFIQGKKEATELLEKEREQIEKACAYGFKDALKPSGSQVLNWKQYYNETFNKNK